VAGTTLISGARRWRAEDIDRAGRKLAGGLRDAGLSAGDSLAVLLRNDFPYFVAHRAGGYLGIDVVPVNWHLKPPEIAYILDDCDAVAVLVHADLLNTELRAVLGDRLMLVVDVPDEIAAAYGIDRKHARCPANMQDWQSWLDGAADIGDRDLQFKPPLFYTSGTTGQPKAVERGTIAPKTAASIAARTRYAWGMNTDDIRAVMTGPLYHSAPNGYANMVLQFGGLLVLQPRFDARELLELIEEYAITHLHMVPIMLSRLLDLPDAQRQAYDLSSLRFVTHGGAPCPPEVKKRMIEWWGSVIHEYYAMTETGIITCSSSEEWLAHPGSVGRAAPGVTIAIRDDSGTLCPPGAAGDICIRHEGSDGISYRNAERKTAELRRDGLLVTGDIGYLDGDGFLYISDRKTEMVLSGGVNIYPAEVEAALMAMPGVRDCAVFGRPDAEFGERVVAVIAAEHDAEDVRDFLSERLASFKIPRDMYFVDSLPREDSGKLKKRLVLGMLEADSQPS
jgi:long-chain acyl-CoA synthetase